MARFDSSSDKRDTVKVLVGTKKDLIAFDEGQKEIRVVDREEVSQFLENYKMTFTFETSAKLNKNISKVFEELSRNLIFNTVEKRKY